MLTNEGAQLLRKVREHIVAHPEQFNWGEWCGTRACIAGHILRCTGQQKRVGIDGGFSELAVKALGLQSDEDLTDAHHLFYGFVTTEDVFDVTKAVAAINALLWKHGYPSEPFVAVLNDRSEEPVSVGAVDPVGEKVTG